jgi:hypothetical protein
VPSSYFLANVDRGAPALPPKRIGMHTSRSTGYPNEGLGQSDNVNVTQLDWNRSAHLSYTRRPSTPPTLQAFTLPVSVVVKGNGNAPAGLAWHHWRQCVSVAGNSDGRRSELA